MHLEVEETIYDTKWEKGQRDWEWKLMGTGKGKLEGSVVVGRGQQLCGQSDQDWELAR